jgi:hypothetical protein
MDEPHAGRDADGHTDESLVPSLLTQLSAEYPELSGRAVAETLEQANRASSLLGGDTDGSRGRITSLARDRLEALRIRAAAAARRAGSGSTPPLEVFAAGRAGRRPRADPAAVATRARIALIDESRFDRLVQVVGAGRGDVPVSADSLCRSVAEALDVGAVALSVPDGLSTAQTIGVHGSLARRLEELQVTIGEGPSLDGLRGSDTVVGDLDAAEPQNRWPLFAPVAADAGVQSLCVLPMHVGAARFGVLVLYFDRTGALSAEGMAEARTFAVIALELLLDHAGPSGRESDADPSRDRRFFDDRPEIHQATGMVSIQLGVDVRTALLRIRARAYAEGRLLSEMAADVVARTLHFDEREQG